MKFLLTQNTVNNYAIERTPVEDLPETKEIGKLEHESPKFFIREIPKIKGLGLGKENCLNPLLHWSTT